MRTTRSSSSRSSPPSEAPFGLIRSALARVPPLDGKPIRLRFEPTLGVRPGGREVHASTFLRRREIVLEAALLAHPREFERIFLHELFHFAWLRLGNGSRRSYEGLLESELRLDAAGELGWSAEWRKRALVRRDRNRRTRRWREYVCESFCDTAAWCLARGRHAEFTLAAPFRRGRRQWFRKLLGRAAISI